MRYDVTWSIRHSRQTAINPPALFSLLQDLVKTHRTEQGPSRMTELWRVCYCLGMREDADLSVDHKGDALAIRGAAALFQAGNAVAYTGKPLRGGRIEPVLAVQVEVQRELGNIQGVFVCEPHMECLQYITPLQIMRIS